MAAAVAVVVVVVVVVGTVPVAGSMVGCVGGGRYTGGWVQVGIVGSGGAWSGVRVALAARN